MDVVEELEQVEKGLVWLEEGEMGVTGCPDLQVRFEDLRGLYRERPELLEPHLDRLKQLSQRFEDYKQTHLQEFVDEFHRQNAVLQEAKRTREFVRGWLIEVAASRGTQMLAGRESRVEIKESRAARLPKAGTEERQKLEDLIEAAGQWKAVSQLSARLLNKVLADDGFVSAQKQEIEGLVGEERTWRVVSVSEEV